MAENGGGPGVTTELLEHVQQLESYLRQAESVVNDRAAELEWHGVSFTGLVTEQQ